MTQVQEQSLSPTQIDHTYRRNFYLFLLDGTLFTVAMGIISASTVIPDFIRRLTDSEVLIGLSSSLFAIGWMLPQLLMARYLVRTSRKKWWFVGPNIPVRFAILVFSGIIVLVGKDQPGTLLVAFLVAYGIAAVGDGIVGVPWVDLMGSSMDNRRRAWMFGYMTAITSVIMLGVSPFIRLVLGDDGPGFPDNYALLFGIAGVLFMISIPLGFFIRELPGGKATESVPSFREYIPHLGRVLRQDSSFRAMIITRLFTSLFRMAEPFYIGFATEQLGMANEVAVPDFLIMQIIGTLVGSLLYSWMGNRHNLLYIRLSLLTAVLMPACALLATLVGPAPLYLAFFVSGLTLANLFSSYMNWVIMHASSDQLPVYTGLFNTVSAVILLIAPLIGGTIVERIGHEALFSVALFMLLGALFVVVRYVKTPSPKPSAQSV